MGTAAATASAWELGPVSVAADARRFPPRWSGMSLSGRNRRATRARERDDGMVHEGRAQYRAGPGFHQQTRGPHSGRQRPESWLGQAQGLDDLEELAAHLRECLRARVRD